MIKGTITSSKLKKINYTLTINGKDYTLYGDGLINGVPPNGTEISFEEGKNGAILKNNLIIKCNKFVLSNAIHMYIENCNPNRFVHDLIIKMEDPIEFFKEHQLDSVECDFIEWWRFYLFWFNGVDLRSVENMKKLNILRQKLINPLGIRQIPIDDARKLCSLLNIDYSSNDIGNAKLMRSLWTNRTNGQTLIPPEEYKNIEINESFGLIKTENGCALREIYEKELEIYEFFKKNHAKQHLHQIDQKFYEDLTNAQKEGLNLLNWHVSIIQGYGGTGKSFLIERICTYLTENKIKFVCLTFTGKASDVLKKRFENNLDSSLVMTIHSYLLKNPIYDGVVIIDEMSMVSGELFSDLLEKINNCQLLMVGDIMQLEPFLSWGKLFIDLYNNPLIQRVNLVEVKRNTNSLSGDLVKFRNSEISFRCEFKSDYIRFNEPDEGRLLQLYSNIIEKSNGSHLGVQIIVSSNDERIALNRKIQKKYFNTHDIVPGSKIIFTKNNSKRGTLNGVIDNCTKIINNFESSSFGYKGATEKKTKITNYYIQNGSYGTNQDTELAYAITGHKSQGSEWDIIILYIPYNPSKCDKKWLYTVLSRAKRIIHVFCKSEVFNSIATRKFTNLRNNLSIMLNAERF